MGLGIGGVRTSLNASLSAQWIGLVLNGLALSKDLLPKDLILSTVLWIETIVQVIQLSFYTWFSYNFHTVVESTFLRYYDWVVTTPLMLFSTMIYYDYQNKPDETVTLESFLREHWWDVLVVFAFNMIMLVFGYFYERGILDLLWSQVIGFAGFAGSFYVIWDRFASKSPDNLWLYLFMVIVWGLYGVAAMFPTIPKNISYNLLDVVSKNFYGVFLSLLIVGKSV